MLIGMEHIHWCYPNLSLLVQQKVFLTYQTRHMMAKLNLAKFCFFNEGPNIEVSLKHNHKKSRNLT